MRFVPHSASTESRSVTSMALTTLPVSLTLTSPASLASQSAPTVCEATTNVIPYTHSKTHTLHLYKQSSRVLTFSLHNPQCAS